MEFYTEPERKIEIADRADVIVAGGGPAGYSAAIAAARNGADTILIEQHNCVGGMATTGMMSHFTGGCDSVLFNEMMDRVQKEQGGIFCKSQGAGRYQIYHELLKKVLLALVKFYRAAFSPYRPPCCRYYPTCSQYALEAIEKYGALKGGWLAFRRILRCNPFHKGGYDPVP